MGKKSEYPFLSITPQLQCLDGCKTGHTLSDSLRKRLRTPSVIPRITLFPKLPTAQKPAPSPGPAEQVSDARATSHPRE